MGVLLGPSWGLHKKERIYTTKGSEGARDRVARASREPHVRNVKEPAEWTRNNALVWAAYSRISPAC